MIKKYPITVFLGITLSVTYLILSFLFIFELEKDSVYTAALLPASIIGLPFAAWIIIGNRKLDAKKFVIALLVIGSAFLLRTLRPDLGANNNLPISKFAEDFPALIIFLLYIILLSFFIAKRKDTTIKRESWKVVLIGFLFFPFIMILVNLGANAVGFGTRFFTTSFNTLSLQNIVFIGMFHLPFYLLIGGAMEELGWRTVLLPLYQRRFSPLLSSIFVAFFWAIWHLPNDLYKSESYHYTNLISRFGVCLVMSIILTWFFNKYKSSIQLILLHGMSNFCLSFVPSHGGIWFIILFLVACVLLIQGKMWRKNGIIEIYG